MRKPPKIDAVCPVPGTLPGRLAQLARAPRLHRGRHRFESCTAHHNQYPAPQTGSIGLAMLSDT